MKHYTFNFTAHPLVIQSEKPIAEKHLDQIAAIIDQILFEVNHANYDSSAFFFNEAKPGSYHETTAAFFFFLGLNMHYAEKYSNFMPFNVAEKTFLSNISPSQYLQTDSKSAAFYKHKPITLDSTYLKNALVLDTVADYLWSKTKMTALISAGLLHRAIGTSRWNVDLAETHEAITPIELHNESMVIVHKREHGEKQVKGFLSTDININHQIAVLKATSPLVQIKSLSEETSNLFMRSDYRNFGKRHGASISIVDANDEFHTF